MRTGGGVCIYITDRLNLSIFFAHRGTTAGKPGKEKPMTITDFFQKLTAGEMAGWAITVLILLMSLIQISPLKLNPWDRILGWIGKKTQGELRKQVADLQKQVTDIWISSHRQSILMFARECRADIDHDAEEWNHILSIADEYEVYCSSHAVSNGVVKADTRYIRDLYQDLSRGHKI